MAQQGGRADVAGVQYLRGFAALLVVLFHLSVQLSQLAGSDHRLATFNSGVDLFFEISGFVMVYSTRYGTEITPGLFIRRRIARIVPLYWVFNLAMVAVVLVAPSLVKASKLDAGHALASFFFLPALNPVGNAYLPLIALGWTLNFEMLFYVVFTLAIAFGQGSARAVMALAFSPLVLLSAARLGGPMPGPIGFYVDPVLLEFVFGMLIAMLFLRAPRMPLPWALLIGGIGLLLLLVPPAFTGYPEYRALRYGLPAMLLMVSGTLARWPRSIPLHRLGDISYSLYLSHFFTVSAFAQFWRRLHSDAGPLETIAFFGAGAMAAIVVGYLTWRLVELPCTLAAKRVLHTGRARDRGEAARIPIFETR